MNWLAHIFLSKNSIDYQLGNLLADPLKGKSWQGASREFKDGFTMHRRIDAFTDAHGLVARSKRRLGDRGYLRGVVIDIAYDYLLMKNWSDYSSVGMEPFMDTFYRNAIMAVDSYPVDARQFVERVIDSGTLTSYGSFRGLETAFRRIDSRLSDRVRTRESALDYMPVLRREITGLEQDFSQFFPQLVAHFKSTACGAPDEHWLK